MTEKLGVFFLHCEDGLVDSTGTFTNVTNTNSAFAVYSEDAKSGSNSMSATSTSAEDVVISFSTPSNTAALNFEEDTAGAVTFDCWIKLENVVGKCPIAAISCKYLSGETWVAAPFLQLEYNKTYEQLYAVIYYGIESIVPVTVNNIVFSAGWNHLALVAQHAVDNSTTISLYLNGVVVGSITADNGYTTYPSFYRAIDIGVGYENNGLSYIVDNVRLNNQALWTSDFDVSKEADMFYPLGTYGGGTGSTGITYIVNTSVPNNIVTSQTPTVTVSGTAPTGTVEVLWENITYGEGGTASGTETWIVEDMPLNNWMNIVDITAVDTEGGTTTERLIIKYLPNYNRLSSIYNSKGIRGLAKQGYVRPTISQFLTSKNWTPTASLVFTGTYSANKCVGGTVSASGGLLPSKAFDGDTNTSYINWSTNAWNFTSLPETPPWIQYQFTEAQQIEKIVMYNSNNTNGVEGVASFVLYGSNDGNTFTEITTGNRQNAGVAGAESFTFENSNKYLIYRFQATFYGAVGGSGASLYELQMMEGIYA